MAGLLLLLLAVLTVTVRGTVYQNISSLTSSTDGTFDFIVVGGGIGGSVVASRLSENPSFKVLLIEAGPDNDGVLEMTVPGYNGRISKIYDWNFSTVAQKAIDNRTFSYARGHVLGGSSSINAMIYTRGAADDYDRWAKVTGDDGWSWKSLFALVKKHEAWVPPPGGRNITGQFDPSVHGTSGKLSVSLPWSNATDFDKACLQSAEAHKDEFPFNVDQSSGYPLGLTWQQSTIGNGERSSAATAYLDATVRKRKNLSIVLNTYATRVLQAGTNKLDIRRVEVAPRKGGTTQVLTAQKEVILAGGTFGTPQILLNSGIGDEQELAKVNISTIHHLPDVGKNMHDHIAIRWDAQSSLPSPPSTGDSFKQWQENRTGPLTEASLHLNLWSRMPNNSSALAQYGDPSAGRNAPHFETMVSVASRGFTTGFMILLTQYSRGSVKIRSDDPFAKPLIDPGYLSHPFDMEAMKEGMRNTVRFFGPPAFEGLLSSVSPNPDTVSDTQFRSLVRSRATGWGHPTSTASMSSKDSESGVVDPDLKVKGIVGLRVVDASAMPFVVSAHTMASVYLFAERAAELIQEEWSSGL